jgi:aminotransferase
MATSSARLLSGRTQHLREASVLRTLTERVSALSDGINLGQGVCDLDPPAALRVAAVHAIQTSRATYTPYAGIEPLRREIVARMARRHELVYQPGAVVVTTGASTAMMATLLTLIEPGDEVILLEPFYPYHRSAALLAGARIRTIPCPTTDEDPAWDQLTSAIDGGARILILNTPANPHGKVWSKKELDRLAALLADTPTLVVTDEIYEDLVYDDLRHVPPASRRDLFPRTVTISGLSKAYSVTGWRLGWLAAPAELAEAIGPVFDVLSVCASRPIQEACVVALHELPESYYVELRDGYARRRDRLADALAAAGLAPSIPAGAYYMLADYRERFGEIESRQACFRLLEELHVAAIPGEIFYADEPKHVLRFHFAVEDEVLAEVARRLEKGRA